MNRYSVIFEGRVQGVGFRHFTRQTARRCRLTGFVRNLFDGTVEAEVQGPQENISEFLKIMGEGNGFSRISRYTLNQIKTVAGEKDFVVRF